jgi:hypothetical protein
LVRLRDQLQEDFASRLRQLHRAVDLGFPEFTRHVRTLESQLAASILSRYPTAVSFRSASAKKLAGSFTTARTKSMKYSRVL